MTAATLAAGASRAIALVLVVAAAENGVIGRQGGLPWRLKSDMKHFRRTTMGKPVVMGRKTFLSLPKPLAGRTNVVVSRDPDFAAYGAVIAPTLCAALTVARADALRRRTDEIAVIGGADIFEQTLPLADRLVLTRVHAEPTGDTLFPPIRPEHWREVGRSTYPASEGDDCSFDVVNYDRVTPAVSL